MRFQSRLLLFEVSDEFVSTEREELDFLAEEDTAEETREEEVMDETELSFLDSKEFFFTAETDFDLDVLLIELRDSTVVSSVDSAETVKNSRQTTSLIVMLESEMSGIERLFDKVILKPPREVVPIVGLVVVVILVFVVGAKRQIRRNEH